MTLSSLHQDLIGCISMWCKNYASAKDFLVFEESVGESARELPPAIDNYRPDVAWLRSTGAYEFIGEAKTANDLKSKHTRNQLTAFLSRLDAQNSGELILAVPWGHEAYATSMMRHLQTKLTISEKRWVVISNAPGHGNG